MAKNISISDDVYDRLTREKGDRSFSEVIAEKLEGGGTVKEVSGQKIFAEGTMREVEEEIDRLSGRTVSRVDDETA